MRETHTPDKYIKDIVKQVVEFSTFVNFSISGNNSLPLVVCGLCDLMWYWYALNSVPRAREFRKGRDRLNGFVW
jgi:hypothetical protein